MGCILIRMRVLLLCVLALPLIGQGTYRRLVPVPPDIRAAQAPTYAPNYFVTAGGGDQTPGTGAAFAYWSVSRFLGEQNWASVITEYSMAKGQVITCPLAGVSHAVGGIGPVTFGLVGAGGACSGSVSGSSSAASAQGFAVFHIAGSWSIIFTARRTFTNPTCAANVADTVCNAMGRDIVRFTLGFGYGK